MNIVSRAAYFWPCILLYILSKSKAVYAKDKCQPVTWGKRDLSSVSSASELPPLPDQSAKFGSDGPKAGDLVCRFYIPTKQDVNYYTCTALAQTAGIENEEFFSWNPDLKTDCSNIQSWNWYCVDGCRSLTYLLASPSATYEMRLIVSHETVIEPLRAWDGKCGPPHNNATCSGTDRPCCNAKTFTCGDTR